ncbi:MAG: ethanolamine utilization protein EutN [Gemmataceae bacterium]
MQLARVVGHAIATVKHKSLVGWRLVVVQPLNALDAPDGDPLLAIDLLGTRAGDSVIVSNDGQGARELVGQEDSPVRWFVMGLADAGGQARTSTGG